MNTGGKKGPRYGKLLDAWTPPDDAGNPLGCLATSFTFDPAFFEEECLGRFLNLETDPTSDGPLYLVEREEKLAQLACATVLVDAHHCRGSRSLRWDLLPARVTSAVQHAKISLLAWTGWIRLIVASANLTPDGCRRNLELFGVLDYHPGAEAPLGCLRETLSFLGMAVGFTQPDGESDSPALVRWSGFLDRLAAIPEDWGLDEAAAGRSPLRAFLVTSGPEMTPVLDQVQSLWPGGGPPDKAVVLSPFFDPPEAENRPAKELWSKLRRRGRARVDYLLSADELSGGTGFYLHAPESLIKAQPTGRPEKSGMYRLELDGLRPLHAKSLVLENDRWALHLIGSSNFTSAGFGLARRPNLEANLAYLVDSGRDPASHKELGRCLPNCSPLDPDLELQWQPRTDEGEDSPGEELVLPSAFGWAIYRNQSQEEELVSLSFTSRPPAGWRMCLEDDEEKVFYDHKSWQEDGEPGTINKVWNVVRPPSGFWVSWPDAEGMAWWPVNVESPASLPPPEELRNLPLEVLIDILTSTRPLHRVLRGYQDRGLKWTGADRNERDPHKRVDVSEFLLQRTRRVSWALTALKHRLELPVASRQSLEWRLHGPVGVAALAQAISKEAEDRPEEKAFLLCELALELATVQPGTAPGCLSPEEVIAGLREVAVEIENGLDLDHLQGNQELQQYVEKVFSRIRP